MRLNRIFSSAFSILILAATAQAQIDYVDEEYNAYDYASYYDCPILDAEEDSYWNAYFGYALPAGTDAPAWDDIGVFELGGEGSLAFVETDSGGDFDLKVRLDSIILNGFDGGSSAYFMDMLYLKAQYSQRFINGYGLRVDAMPGIYSDLRDIGGDDFSMPFGFHGIKAFNEQTAAFLGLSIYPTFDHVVDPRIGVRYTDNESLTAEIAYPETKVVYKANEYLDIIGGARFWLWPEFQMEDEDAREKIMFDESRIYGGFEYNPNDIVKWGVQAGYVFGRELEFETGASPVEIDNAAFIRFTIRGLY